MLAGTSDALAVELDGSTEVAWEGHEWEEECGNVNLATHDCRERCRHGGAYCHVSYGYHQDPRPGKQSCKDSADW